MQVLKENAQSHSNATADWHDDLEIKLHSYVALPLGASSATHKERCLREANHLIYHPPAGDIESVVAESVQRVKMILMKRALSAR